MLPSFAALACSNFCLITIQVGTKNPAVLAIKANSGMALGPLFVGLVSDFLKADYGDDSLRWALMAIIPFAAAAGLAQLDMARHLDKDLAA